MDKWNWKYFIDAPGDIPEVLVGALIAFILIIVYIRIFGLKSFTKMTGFDFAKTIAVGTLLSSSIAVGKPPLFIGLIILFMLFLLNYIISYFRLRSKTIKSWVDNTPVYLMKNGKVINENLKTFKITKDELRAKLREANVYKLENVRAVVFETTGDISVLHNDQNEAIEDFIMEDIREI